MNSIDKTTYLFSMLSAITGIGRVLDITGQMNAYNTSDSPAEADARALAKDWEAIGQDIQYSMNMYV